MELGKYEGEIHSIPSTASYLPISFDEFGGFVITGAYHSTIIEYRFEGGDHPGEYQCFSHYLYAVSKGCKYAVMQCRRDSWFTSMTTTGVVWRRSSSQCKSAIPTSLGC